MIGLELFRIRNQKLMIYIIVYSNHNFLLNLTLNSILPIFIKTYKIIYLFCELHLILLKSTSSIYQIMPIVLKQ